jgi:hypothetical protein
MRKVAEIFFDKTVLKMYFCPTAESGSSPTVGLPEIDHLNHIVSVDPQWWDTINPRSAGDFKECDSHWLFFVQLRNIMVHSLQMQNSPLDEL